MKVQSPRELGIFVREQRKKRGWTQAELASQAGVQALWISQFERGKPTAQIGLVMQTLKALDAALSVADTVPPRSNGQARTVDLDSLIQPASDTIATEPDEITDESIQKTLGEDGNTDAG